MNRLPNPSLPPGLKAFAAEAHLSDDLVEKLADMWGTIRGKRPATVEEWRELYIAIQPYLPPEWSAPCLPH